MHIYFSQSTGDSTLSIGRSHDSIHIARSTDGATSWRYRFQVGKDLDLLAKAVFGALTTQGASRCYVGQVYLPDGVSTRVDYRSGALLLCMRLASGHTTRVLNIEGEELRWLARAVSDLQRFAFREASVGKAERSKRAIGNRRNENHDHKKAIHNAS